ncbi:hypothetical protein D9Q98_001545 [Chlorella vulgaris]|uniref:Cupin type-1 domain-containing protein n=1 Tax=Chlorella vulgaris TaxID=3077 RepID=A0A9D4U0N6_CHLVU|nr:hypothetical protein D9Q98_001545 [Chlorella vulgaris]
MARSTFAAVALALVCCIVTAQAQLVYTGPESFINSFDTAGNQLTAEGAMISIISAGQVYGSNVAGMSASLINLDPCTIIEPHTHPHSEFAFTVYGSVTHSTPYNNLTLFNLTANEGTAEARGFAIFPSNQLHVTYNPTCEPAQILSVFCSPYPSLNFFPYAQSFLPKEVTKSYFDGCVSNKHLAKPIITAKLEGCKCKDGKRTDRKRR